MWKIVSIFLITVALIAGTVGFVAHHPIEIRDWYDLNAIRYNLGGTYLLMNNLDSSTAGYEELASETANQGKGWRPIGTFLVMHGPTVFKGTFAGQGYEIHDLFINRPDEIGVGLFAVVGGEGRIEDIGVVNATVTGGALVGLFAEVSGGGHIKDIGVVNAIVTGEAIVGGLVGRNYYGTVSSSYYTGSVTGNSSVGGLVGVNDHGTVSNCYATSNVSGNLSVGGLVGENAGTLSNSYATGSVTGEDDVGGLVGQNVGTVSNSYSTGSVTGEDDVGGLVGLNTDYATVSNSYSTGNVTGNRNVGGLVGYNYDGIISNSYSTGSVTGTYYVGGLVGKNPLGTVGNSFWDTETSGQATSDGGTGKTTAEMQDIATFSGAGWNIIEVTNPATPNPAYIWNIPTTPKDYPFLSWQS